MADVTGERAARTEAPTTLGSRLRYAGPGIVIAVTGVGAGDMVSSLVAGTGSLSGPSFSVRSSSTS